MSSTTAAATTTAQTYWCHECDMSVSLLTTTTSTAVVTPFCPNCHSDFLELMDYSIPNANPNPNRSNVLFPNLTPQYLTPTSDDNYLLDSPYLHRLIHNLDREPTPAPRNATTTTITIGAPANRQCSPTSWSSLRSLPTITITPDFLRLDPAAPCPICKDQFALGDEAKRLPCRHVYHSDCILPWLRAHSSCPVCRYQMPTANDDEDAEKNGTGRGMMRLRTMGGPSMSSIRDFLTLAEAEEEEEGRGGEDLFGFGFTLRQLARRHNLAVPRREFPTPTHQGGEDAEVVVERESSVETVESFPDDVAEMLGGGVSRWSGWDVQPPEI